MEIKTQETLSSANRSVWSKAQTALKTKNYKYAIELLQNLLRSEPAFLDGRRILRLSAANEYKNASSFSKSMLGVTTSAKLMTASSKKTPQEKMIAAEEVLAVDPFNKKANNLLAEAAHAEGYDEIAAFAYETIADGDPKDTDNLHTLGDYYMKIGEYVKASQTYDRITQVKPNDGEALSKRKQAEAAEGSKSYSAEGIDGWRQGMRDKEQAQAREEQSRAVQTEETAGAEIRRLLAKREEEPDNKTLSKRIAKLYADLGGYENYEQATAWYEVALEEAGGSDQALRKQIDDIRLKMNAAAIKGWEEHVAENPDDEEARATLEAARAERQHLMIHIFERRVELYPNDYQFRYDLGKAYFEAGDFKQAMEQLQLGMRQPSVRPQAQLYLARCHMEKKMYDLAAKNLSAAKDERPTMDDVKKEMTYQLAVAYRSMGEKEKAIEQVKEIYEVDMGYKDVSEWVESSYA